MKNIYAFGLSVCRSVYARSNCSKYSSDVFKFIHAAHNWYGMNSIENYMYGTKCSFTETHKSFPIQFSLSEGGLKFAKFIITYLHCTKYNKIKYFIQLYKSVFRIQDCTKDFWYIMGYTWKRLDRYFKLFFLVCFH